MHAFRTLERLNGAVIVVYVFVLHIRLVNSTYKGAYQSRIAAHGLFELRAFLSERGHVYKALGIHLIEVAQCFAEFILVCLEFYLPIQSRNVLLIRSIDFDEGIQESVYPSQTYR